jgi:four helix bundle protein
MKDSLLHERREKDLKKRTKQFALRAIKIVESLPKTQTAGVIGNQSLRSSTSVPAIDRAACRARSTAEFISRIGVVEEETDESVFWIEMLVDAGLVAIARVDGLMGEGNELTPIWVTSINTARGGKRRR